ncbi:MAG: molybdopterin molybdotransferase MoeA [Chloroflexi bacterium]|nr:molybdopterin molybdotransferase MoeA [Chloroflexota bacterium]
MVPVPDALAAILERTTALPTESVPLVEALGRVLAREVAADADLPGLPRSSVDGYAVRSADSAPDRRVLAEVTAGRLAHTQVGSGEAVAIMTGGTIPQGADAVVMVEDTDHAGEVVRLHRLPHAAENIHPPGMDLVRGQVVARAGERIGPSEVGLLASVGASEVPVVRRPRVAILATGDEVVEPWETPPPGAVRDSNRYALMASAQAAGATVVWHRHGRDDEALLASLVREALEVCDVLITSGGVSMGTRDLMKPLLERTGTVHFGRVSFKPGKPLTFATTAAGQLLFGLPGFPVSSLVTFEVFVRPALLKLGGHHRVLRPRVQARIVQPLRPDPLRLEYQRVRVRWEDGELVAHSTGLQASSRLLSIAGANGLLEIEPGTVVLPAGTRIPTLLLVDLDL